jgi:hypothetical protein
MSKMVNPSRRAAGMTVLLLIRLKMDAIMDEGGGR